MVSLADISEFIGKERFDLDGVIKIDSPNALHLARNGQITFIQKGMTPRRTEASCLIAPPDFQIPTYSFLSKEIHTFIIRSENPRLDFIRVCNQFFPPPKVDIDFGLNCEFNPTCFIGKDGFGYERDEYGRLEKFPHYAGVKIGKNVSVGAFTTIDRGVFEDTEIGDGTKIDNNVHIAHNCKIGKNCLIVAGSVLGGGVEVGDNSYLMINSMIKPQVKIGKNCQVGMGAVVLNDAQDNTTVVGNPARELRREAILI